MYSFELGAFTFRLVDDLTYAIMAYHGNEEHVVVPESHGGKPVTVIYDEVFKGHAEMKSIYIPDSVTDLGEFLFDGCVNLKEIRLSQNLSSLWPYAFARCGVEELQLPDTLTTIAPFTFKDCKSLRKVTCGAGMRKINANAFAGCDALKELMFGPNVDFSPKAFG